MPRSQRPRKKQQAIRKFHRPINPIAVRLASDTDAIPTDVLSNASAAPQFALARVTGSEPSHIHSWMILCDAINVMHTLVDINAASDPSGLITDAKEGIKRAIERKKTTVSPHPSFDAPGLQAVRQAIDSYPEILASVTHKMYLFALNETSVRLQAETQKTSVGTTVVDITCLGAAGAYA